ncbi:MAG: hypothetical protein ACPGSD_12920 [Flavobacteriales bacterium]
MTVIIGYINSNRNDIVSALYSDNLELKNDNSIKKVVDKIIKIDDRYFIGSVGLGLTKLIINVWIKYFEDFQDAKKSFENINQLTASIKEGINECITLWKIDNIINEAYLKEFGNHLSSLVILDKKNNELFYVELGKILKGEIKMELQKLEKGTLYEFGIPASINDKDYNMESCSIFNRKGIDLLIKEKLRHIRSNIDADIGLLGSYFIRINENEEFNSAFKNKGEIIKNYFK